MFPAIHFLQGSEIVIKLDRLKTFKTVHAIRLTNQLDSSKFVRIKMRRLKAFAIA